MAALLAIGPGAFASWIFLRPPGTIGLATDTGGAWLERETMQKHELDPADPGHKTHSHVGSDETL